MWYSTVCREVTAETYECRLHIFAEYSPFYRALLQKRPTSAGIQVHMCTCTPVLVIVYGVAMIGRLLKITGLFCRI